MKKGWRIIFGIVFTALILGAVCCGVGLLTGADINRIIINVNDRYQLMTYVNAITEYGSHVFQQVAGLF